MGKFKTAIKVIDHRIEKWSFPTWHDRNQVLSLFDDLLCMGDHSSVSMDDVTRYHNFLIKHPNGKIKEDEFRFQIK